MKKTPTHLLETSGHKFYCYLMDTSFVVWKNQFLSTYISVTSLEQLSSGMNKLGLSSNLQAFGFEGQNQRNSDFCSFTNFLQNFTIFLLQSFIETLKSFLVWAKILTFLKIRKKTFNFLLGRYALGVVHKLCQHIRLVSWSAKC